MLTAAGGETNAFSARETGGWTVGIGGEYAFTNCADPFGGQTAFENDLEATRIRATMRRALSGNHPKRGGILNALRRSPLVGVDLDLSR